MELGIATAPVFANAILVVDGCYAMQFRDAAAPEGALTWGLFGGAINRGETAQQAIVREIREELEIELRRAWLFWSAGRWVFFASDVTGDWPRHVLHEGERAALFTPQQIGYLPRHRIVDQAISAFEARRAEWRDKWIMV